MGIIKESSATLRPDLQTALFEYDQAAAERKFIGRAVLPFFESEVDAGEYAVYKRENLLQVPDDEVSDDAGYNRVDSRVGSKTFSVVEYGLEYPLSDRKARRYARYYDAETAEVNRMWFQLLLAHERRVAALVATCTTGAAVGVSWATVASADPITDVDNRAAALADRSGLGKEDLTLITSRANFMRLVRNAAILDRCKYTAREVGRTALEIQRRLIADALGIKDVLVGAAGYNSKAKGGTVTITAIWGDTYSYLAKLGSEGDSLETPCLGRTILWPEDSPQAPTVETYREEKVRRSIIRVRWNTDEILQGSAVDLFCERITH